MFVFFLANSNDFDFSFLYISFRRGYYSGDLPTTINSATTSTDAEDSDQTEEKKNEENIPPKNLIFVIACMVAISIDPLFLYIPIIDGESKCLGVDKKLRIITLLFRSLIDIIYIVHITYQIRQAIKSALPEDQSHPNEQTLTSSTWKSKFFDLFERRDKTFEFSWTSIIIDVLAVLPIPQVLLGAVYFKMGGSRYLDNIKIVNFFLLVQYLPRFYEIYLAATKFRKNTPVWIKGAFNFFLYIIASHVLGAFRYFFSIERETACWHQACRNTAGCKASFYCDDNISMNVTTLLTEFCPTNPLNSTVFDFGIFSKGIESGNTGRISFLTKLFYSWSWGILNLSNFGTSLTTSSYVWENLFAILISAIGLLLFSYLIGNVQNCLLWEEEKKVQEPKRKIIMEGLRAWLSENNLRPDLEKEVVKNIKQAIELDKDADVDNLFSLLPWSTRLELKRSLFKPMIKLPRLRNMDEKVREMICDYLKPVVYPQNTIVRRTGEPFDSILFVTEGIVWVYSTTDGSQQTGMMNQFLKKGDVYGDEELLSWTTSHSGSRSFTNLPFSKENVKCHTKVQGFALSAMDLKTVVSKCGDFWNPSKTTTLVLV
ncbi:hypothetical protein DVH24_014600 [Malus domestica]|uniref:Cyclic nucleotide-binding domain-containing protein n=1 Tax=Malus domestica TaxID=3750 RepID=A0A498KNN0_MALDO|nr:hypothetical protein DVH24_014600 [Malus domestica]